MTISTTIKTPTIPALPSIPFHAIDYAWMTPERLAWLNAMTAPLLTPLPHNVR